LDDFLTSCVYPVAVQPRIHAIQEIHLVAVQPRMHFQVSSFLAKMFFVYSFSQDVFVFLVSAFNAHVQTDPSELFISIADVSRFFLFQTCTVNQVLNRNGPLTAFVSNSSAFNSELSCVCTLANIESSASHGLEWRCCFRSYLQEQGRPLGMYGHTEVLS